MKITIVTTMRDEAPHVLEWIAHHRAAGVTDFVIYTNECSDGTDRLLDLLPWVHHVAQGPGERPPQWRALKAAWDHPVMRLADWVGCMDCDEFINLNKSVRDIPDLVSRSNADAILLPWRLFGHSNQIDASPRPTTERFTHAAPPDMLYPAIGGYFKTLFRRAGPFRQLGVHRPKQKNPDRHGLPVWVDGSGAALPEGFAARDTKILHWGGPIARDLVQLNHYSVRSAAEFMVKRGRGLPNHRDKPIDLSYWVERCFNTVEDRSIAHMADATRATLSDMMALEGVAEAHGVGLVWHKARFEALMQDHDALKLYGRLILAGSSTPPPHDIALGLVQAYQANHDRR